MSHKHSEWHTFFRFIRSVSKNHALVSGFNVIISSINMDSSSNIWRLFIQIYKNCANKTCDQISDTVLNAHLKQDPKAKVACETVVKCGLVLLCGEISSKAKVDYQKIVQETVQHIGYNTSERGFDYKTCTVFVNLDEESPNIAAGIHVNRADDIVEAGDQGMVFGYATNETEECMPFTVLMAHKLNHRISELGAVEYSGGQDQTPRHRSHANILLPRVNAFPFGFIPL
ncbi:S-adenosylmethionine synthase [Blattella germanica]|nr:S-adenosylmethionine synthase [Blattella germanica]